MYKFVCRLLVFFMIFQTIPELAHAATGDVTRMVNKAFAPNNTVRSVKELYPRDWVAAVLMVTAINERDQQQAQQPPAAADASQASPSTGQEVAPREWPWFGKGFSWEKPGASPMIPASLIPGFGQGDEDKDMEIIQGVILGEPGYEVPYRLFWAFVSMSVYNGQTPDPYFVEDLKGVVKRREYFRQKLAKSTVFRTRMGWGYKDTNGVPQIKLTGIPMINFDQEIFGYIFGTAVPRSGMYRDLPLSLVVPEVCFNGVFQEGVPVEATITQAPVPVERPKTAKQVVRKEWRNIQGKKVDAPDRTEVQVRFEAIPVTGGDKVVAEAYDNKQAELELEVGREYTIRELVDSMQWRADREQVTVRVGEKNDPLRIVNTEVPQQTTEANPFATAVPGPPGPRGPEGPTGKFPWKRFLITSGIITAAGIGACIAWCPSDQETLINVVEPHKLPSGDNRAP